MKCLALNVDFNGVRFDPLGSRSPPYERIKFGYPLENVRFLLLSTNLAREWLQIDKCSTRQHNHLSPQWSKLIVYKTVRYVGQSMYVPLFMCHFVVISFFSSIGYILLIRICDISIVITAFDNWISTSCSSWIVANSKWRCRYLFIYLLFIIWFIHTLSRSQ